MKLSTADKCIPIQTYRSLTKYISEAEMYDSMVECLPESDPQHGRSGEEGLLKLTFLSHLFTYLLYEHIYAP